MNRTQHPSNNRVLGAPGGLGDVDCSALPITDMEVDGIPCVASFWRPTKDELARLNAGQLVQLTVMGRTHAPVSVAVTQE